MTVETITRKRHGKHYSGIKTSADHTVVAGATPETLSPDALYLLVLADKLKRLLGPASLQNFLATGETRIIHSTVNF